MVIQRVWENLGRSVSRVSKELSMSPKKVRRLLQHADVTAGTRRGRRSSN